MPTPSEPMPADLREASRAELLAELARGAVLALPTESSYALAARADRPEALALAEQCVGGAADVCRFATRSLSALALPLAPIARRLAAACWPGPLVLAMDDEREASRVLRLRRPAAAATLELLDEASFEIALCAPERPSAPWYEPEALRALLAPRGLRVLAGVPGSLREPPAELRLGRGRFELARAGLYEREELERLGGLSILFVCTGNTCRSPMAEGIARKLLADRLGVAPAQIGRFGFSVGSAGTFAAAGSPASAHAVTIAREIGADIGRHQAQLLSERMLAHATRVYCVTAAHLVHAESMLPRAWNGRIELLDPRNDVSDPVGGAIDDYRRCARQIRTALERLLEEWA